MSWQPKKTASSAQPRVTQSADCYLSLMRRHQIPYLPHAMQTDHHTTGIVRRTDHPAVGIKRQLRPNNSPPHYLTKTGMKQLGTLHTTFGRPGTIKQDTKDRSTDRTDVPQGTTMATYSDVTNLTTPGPNAADGLHQSYAAMRPDTEVPHTLSASRTRYWITNSPRDSSPSISNHMTAQPIPQCGSRISSSTSTWLEEMTSTPLNTSHSSSKGQLGTGLTACLKILSAAGRTWKKLS